jgi:LysM repeat protein
MKHITSSQQNRQITRRAARALRLAGAIAVAVALLAPSADAQRRARGNRGNARPESLRGSKASVEKMYDFAQRYRYPFYLTPTNVDAAVAQGRLVALTGDSTYELTRGVGFSYATREAKQFVTQFAPQYLYACGSPLTVTSAARPLSRQPHNANPHSVHPTGIAVDIRRPPPGPCLTWVRKALADLESRGLIEATEEHHPIHLHLAVLAAPGAKVVLPNLVQGMVAAARVPTAPLASATVVSVANGEVSLPTKGVRTYVVRQGDTLYDIANKTGVSVQALAAENGRVARGTLKPGTTLKVPESGR